MLLKNLVENAIQHSPVGGVVAMTVGADHLFVRDEGPGISVGDLPKLFTRFWRGPMRRNEGAGLGLSICKEIAAAHSWELAARSGGHGAEFILSFRAKTSTNLAEGVLATLVTAAGHGCRARVLRLCLARAEAPLPRLEKRRRSWKLGF